MDREIIERKLESLRHCLQRLENKCPADASILAADFDLQAQAGLLNSELANRLRKAVGFRNIAVHNYENINWILVHSIVKNQLTDFLEFARVVTGTLAATNN